MLQFIISRQDAQRLTFLFPCSNISNNHETEWSSSNGTHITHNSKILERQFKWDDISENEFVSLEIAFPKRDAGRPQVWYLRRTDSRMPANVTLSFDEQHNRYVFQFEGHPKPFYFPTDKYNEETQYTIDSNFFPVLSV